MTAPDPLALDDAALRAECDIQFTRSGGPGGQHRNKTESGVRLVHRPTGCIGQAFERRSQAQNLAIATARLRQAIALRVRRPVELQGYVLLPPLGDVIAGRLSSPANPAYWAGAQHLLDVFAAAQCSVAAAAAVLGISTGRLSRVITANPEVMAAANEMRSRAGLAPLRR